MRISFPVAIQQRVRASRPAIIVLGAFAVVSVATVSAHFVKGLGPTGSTSAFVSSPTNTADAPIQVRWGLLPADDTGLRVVCFYVANTSQPRGDRPDWPRVTGVGFELPGSPSGFALLEPLNADWGLVEGVTRSLAGHGTVTLDFAIVADVNPTGRTPGRPHDPAGIPPGQEGGVRGVGTRFCVSGPFPDTLPGLGSTTIERILNGVVVGFHGVDAVHQGTDAGVWFPTPAGTTGPGPVPRMSPLYQ
jgi:hypothetical protein